ncbi:hypothetical protein LC612_27515 [Nostoc sp. CHAB 5834]|nr:hypothetical protein [Nostoc sp. CHAB 5834]
MDTGTDKNNLDWLNPDALVEFIDELRESGYKIGISQYIAAHDLILMLIAQGETLNSPEHLRNLLGPIFCSSPIEQEEFQQHFDCWVELYRRVHLSTEDVNAKAKALSDELETERALFYWIQQDILFHIFIFITLSIILFPSHTEKKDFLGAKPTSIERPASKEALPTVPPIDFQPESNIKPSTTSSFNWQILVLLLTIYGVIFFIWHL